VGSFTTIYKFSNA